MPLQTSIIPQRLNLEIVIISGPPGSGKSSIINEITKLMREKNIYYTVAIENEKVISEAFNGRERLGYCTDAALQKFFGGKKPEVTIVHKTTGVPV